MVYGLADWGNLFPQSLTGCQQASRGTVPSPIYSTPLQMMASVCRKESLSPVTEVPVGLRGQDYAMLHKENLSDPPEGRYVTVWGELGHQGWQSKWIDF
jgi:hypothetical protein